MFGFYFEELLVLLLIGLIIFGPIKLIRIINSLTELIKSFKKHLNHIKSNTNELTDLIQEIESLKNALSENGYFLNKTSFEC